MDGRTYARLSEGQKECLRLFHDRTEIKEIARLIGRSPVTVNQRLASARRHLGVDRSSEAARLLVEHERGLCSPPIYAPNVLSEDQPAGPDRPSEGDDPAWPPMPFPTRGRPDNDLTAYGKIVYALLIAVFVALVFGGAVAALSGLSEIF